MNRVILRDASERLQFFLEVDIDSHAVLQVSGTGCLFQEKSGIVQPRSHKRVCYDCGLNVCCLPELHILTPTSCRVIYIYIYKNIISNTSD